MDNNDLKMLLASSQPVITTIAQPERGKTHAKTQSKAQVKGHSEIIKMRRKK